MSANNQQFQINDHVSVKVIDEIRTHPLYNKSFDGRVYYITEDWINQSNRIEGFNSCSIILYSLIEYNIYL